VIGHNNYYIFYLGNYERILWRIHSLLVAEKIVTRLERQKNGELIVTKPTYVMSDIYARVISFDKQQRKSMIHLA
jgi:hypothetical protein